MHATEGDTSCNTVTGQIASVAVFVYNSLQSANLQQSHVEVDDLTIHPTPLLQAPDIPPNKLDVCTMMVNQDQLIAAVRMSQGNGQDLRHGQGFILRDRASS